MLANVVDNVYVLGWESYVLSVHITLQTSTSSFKNVPVWSISPCEYELRNVYCPISFQNKLKHFGKLCQHFDINLLSQIIKQTHLRICWCWKLCKSGITSRSSYLPILFNSQVYGIWYSILHLNWRWRKRNILQNVRYNNPKFKLSSRKVHFNETEIFL